ncbi:ABC transporter permease protein; putative dipeptide transport protein [Agrobacterium tumefaciens str. Kerr 14]|uniref:ABC transporter permease protein putative dipeptide transport protein n=1 Tax=Agrobacterium tumefaciens str. Kerr 14 TaxID=1183424 RepID=A0A1S7SBJ8_AGRTU|nr:ABC transporter permease [Agrobacterium tumefaciens]CUX65725.1 ABC transporter permease protein; putative dipeptide transport protein [Agrobacterium tumefaciens str. Kerr 14]
MSEQTSMNAEPNGFLSRIGSSDGFSAFRSDYTAVIGLVAFLIIVLIAVLAPYIQPYDPVDQDILARLQGPSMDHWLGTDMFGRDILSRLMVGARYTLAISLVSMIVAVTIGTLIGVLAGYFGGMFDVVLMQIMDVILAFPALILGLILVALLGPTMTNIIFAIAFTTIAPFARVARAPVIALREREFIEAGKAMGFSNSRIILKHLLPNIMPDILVMSSLWLATAVRTEASLAFIGLGIAPPTPTWGGMVREGFENILDSYSLALFPSLAVLALVFSLNLVGDGLRDANDPKLKNQSK